MLRNFETFSLPALEEKILKFWKDHKAFETTLAKRAKKKSFVFYEGPPTANGRPGIHHVLARVFKDLILRYKTMRGFFVLRKGGWDTHGLPVEIEVEKELGLRTKKEIENFGIAAFNRKCRESVWRYKEEWERLTERIGFWLDMGDPYITYENRYLETLWYIVKTVWGKKLMYRGHKVVPWCTRCGTTLSSHELALGYRKVDENSVYIKFKLKKRQTIGKNFVVDDKTYVLSWTTTPWTLPGNVALAIGKKFKYVVVKKNDDRYILEKSIYEKAQLMPSHPLHKEFGLYLGPLDSGERPDKNLYAIPEEFRGKDLIGLEYEPLFDVKPLHSKTSYKIYDADFVTTEDGTGVVHTAVMYGEDDYRLGKKVGLPQHHTVDERGTFTEDVPGFAGMFVKAAETEKKIIDYLKTKNYLLKTETYSHDYPFCWRCDTPLLYYARSSWFIAMSKLRPKLLAENNRIHWVPEYLKEGRFGEWLREAKDWAISRERYWGTPLPIWECASCGHMHTVGSIGELDGLQKSSGNRYFLVRHGEAENNLKDVINHWPEKEKYHLTLKGRTQVEALAKKLKKEQIDVIIASDITRTKETAETIAGLLGVKKVLFDSRLREINTGDFNGCHDRDYHAYYASDLEKFSKRPPNGESLTDLRARVSHLVQELEKTYKKKTILLVSHEYPLWMLAATMQGWSDKEAVKEKHKRGDDFLPYAGCEIVPFLHIPRDETGLADLHRPYIDTVEFVCGKCGGTMRRVPEVMDVWFDSGAMPFAQAHWPFAQTKNLKLKTKNVGIDFPADYIAEGIDQTRGWFYTLLAVSVLLGKGAPYRNVVSLGLVLDRNGQKMSKSKGNVVDPWEIINTYGADAIRWYFFSGGPPGEPRRFDEGELQKSFRQFFLILYNLFMFYETYAEKSAKGIARSTSKFMNVLDRWMLIRMDDAVGKITSSLESYEVTNATRVLQGLLDDFSRWYVRRSRRRFQKPSDRKDLLTASVVLRHLLIVMSKLLAPFTPFFAEALYQSLGCGPHSVHADEWPKSEKKLTAKQQKLLLMMEEVRHLASVALAKRAEVGIKVRQPLALLKINGKYKELAAESGLLDLIREEVNVKQVIIDETLKNEVWLDTKLTHELREEGWLREFVRMVQDLRQDAKLSPKDTIVLLFESAAELRYLLEKNELWVKREVNAKFIEYRRSSKFDIELETKLDEWPLWLGLRKLI